MTNHEDLSRIEQVEAGVYQIPIQLPEVLEPQRADFQEALLAAQRRLRRFAKEHNWERHTETPFARLFQAFADKASFDYNLLKTCGLDTHMKLPATYCAALEQGMLMSVSPELYHAVYPEGDEEHAFEKLLAHEMAHRLHIRLLDGKEEGMGAVWLYEGFALYAAGQFEADAAELSIAEILEIVNEPERGSYRHYASVFRYFMKRASIHELIRNAARDDFTDWLSALVP